MRNKTSRGGGALALCIAGAALTDLTLLARRLALPRHRSAYEGPADAPVSSASSISNLNIPLRVVFILLTIAILAAAVASIRGRNRWIWLFYGLVKLIPLGAIIGFWIGHRIIAQPFERSWLELLAWHVFTVLIVCIYAFRYGVWREAIAPLTRQWANRMLPR